MSRECPRHKRGAKSRANLMGLLIFALVVLVLHQNHFALELVNGNVISQQQQNNSNPQALPGLSERSTGGGGSGGLNSRYLSASGTASLAAATVAAAANSNNNNNNNQPPTAANSQQNLGGAQTTSSSQNPQTNSNNQILASNHQQQAHLAQHGHHTQPQLQQQGSNTAINSNNQANNQVQQYTNIPIAIPQQQQQQQQFVGPATPVVSTTLAYNPLTGQYLPTEFSASSGAAAGLGLGPNQVQQQQQPFFVQQPNQQLTQNPFGFSPGSQGILQPAQLAGSSYLITRQPAQRFQPSQQIQPNYGFSQQQAAAYNRHYPGSSSFTRRNGQLAGGGGGLRNQLGQPVVDDDSNGLFQQQIQTNQNSHQFQHQSGGLLGLGLDQFGPSLQDQVSYLLGQQQQQQHQGDLLVPGSGLVGAQSNSGGIFSSSGSSSPSGQTFGGSNGGGQASGGPMASPFLATSSSSDQCVAADGRHGTCYQASECIRRGGTPMGKCGGGGGGGGGGGLSSGDRSSSGGAHSSGGRLDALADYNNAGSSHVCCLFDITCGQFAAERFVYFRNPGYPQTFDQSRMCRAKIGKLDKSVCQFRLDLFRFDVAKPTNGNCSQDMFVVSGQNENYVIPKICGLNDGQHYYVGVDESGVITLHMMMMGLYRRSFELLITQIPCRSDYAAPAHCLQYYMGTHGTIKSFNYDDDYYYQFGPGSGSASGQSTGGGGGPLVSYDLQQEGSASLHQAMVGGPMAPYGMQFNGNGVAGGLQQRQQLQLASSGLIGGPTRFQQLELQQQQQQYQFGGYPNDLDYTICIRKESGFCSITYQLSRNEQGSMSPFAVGGGQPFGAGFGNESQLGGGGGGGGGGWHQVSTECRDDYLLIGGVRLCSGPPSSSFNQQQQQAGIFEGIGQHQQLFAANNSQQLQLQQQQLQGQANLLMQQLARIQQQQQQQQQGAGNSVGGNVTYANVGLNGGQQPQTGNVANNNNNNANLEQQQAALMQQLMLIQQQQQQLAAAAAGGQLLNGRYQPLAGLDGQSLMANYGQLQQLLAANDNNNNNNLHGTIITDTTSGPFLLRFVSNMARNARGFHIDYRQNPCK